MYNSDWFIVCYKHHLNIVFDLFHINFILYSLPLGHTETVVLCPQQTTGMYTNHRINQDGHWQQFGTQQILISALQWANRPCNAPTWFYRVGKKPSVKADLAIYSYALDVSGWCMIVSLIIFIKLDFSSCANWDGFCKSSHS